MSDALEPAWHAVRFAVQAADSAHLDETDWYQQRDPDPPIASASAQPATPEDPGEVLDACPPVSPSPASAPTTPPTSKLKKAWRWVAVTQCAVLFIIRRSRGSQVVTGRLGSLFAGILTTDRWHAYNWFNAL